MKIPENKKSESGSYSKKVGVFEARVLSLNPDAKQLSELLGGAEINDEPQYQKEKDGEDIHTLSFWVEDVVSGSKFNLRFNLIEKEEISKSGKPLWLNQTGDTAYCDEKENLQVFFTEFQDRKKNKLGDKVVRKAFVGEKNLYAFLRSWINADYYNPETDIFLNWKDIRKGNFKELSSLINTDSVNTVVMVADVRIVDTDQGTKEYQGLYGGAFLGGWKMKLLNNAFRQGKLGGDDKQLNKWYDQVFGEFGDKNSTYFGPLKDYNAEEFLAASNNPIQHSESPTDTEY